ncbi:YjgN family protein [Halobacteriovorax sp. HLS]|uniref:YjgN family protein n=1 Tax=Halobacteriovorax sp. HLS TaxID=2234000 RepID=UPI000FD6C52C|nr:DUF898 family protein [Halobacteriovorax sp. HLS]
MESTETLDESTRINEIEFERMTFDGDGVSFFKIWIVNLVLTIITLGIYGPWAKVRARKYLFNSTGFRGSRFDYHAKAKSILLGRIIALLIFGSYVISWAIHPVVAIFDALIVFLLVPFIIIKSLKFNVNNTSYNNIKFHLRAKVSEGYKLFIKYFSFPMIVSIGALIFLYLSGNLTNKGLKIDENDSFTSAVVGGLYLLNFLYLIIMSSSILNAYLNFFYNNIYYGGSKVVLDTSRKQVTKGVIIPFVLSSLVALSIPIGIAMLSGIGGAASLFIVLAAILLYFSFFYIFTKFPFLIFSFVWNRLSLEGGEMKNDLKHSTFAITVFVNAIVTAVTFGIFYPWTVIRMLRIKTESKSIKIGPLDDVQAVASDKESALGEELGDVLDFDFEIGL